MKITQVRTVLLSHMKEHPPMRRSYALVRVEVEGGTVGWGEASSNYGHSYPTVIRAIVDDVLARNLVGRDAGDIALRTREMHGLLDGYLGWDGVTAQAIGAVEIALWDIAGKVAGKSVAALLGRTTDRLSLYATGTTMFDASPEWYAHYFDGALAAGIRSLKVRLGTDADASIARVKAVRDHAGPGVDLMVDAYWGYTPADALTLAERLTAFDIRFFEEPSPQTDPAFAGLPARFPLPVALGERIYSPMQFAAVAEAGGKLIFEPDACICGGISACMEIAAHARARGIPVIPHLGSPTAVGFAANLQWAAAAGIDLVEYDVYPDLPVRDAILPEPIFALDRVKDGTIAVPQGPGLGIEIDKTRLALHPYTTGGTYAEVFREHERPRDRGT